MTPQEFIKDIQKKAAAIVKENIPLAIAVRTVVALTTQRIFADGKNSSDTNIGQYDTSRAMYINPDASPRLGADKASGVSGLQKVGKTGESAFKNGKAHKTAYVANYKDFRNKIGRRIDKVNLNLTGQLASDFANAKIDPNFAKININEKDFKVNANTYVVSLKNAFNAIKRDGLEKKYGTVFQPTPEERKKFFDTANFELYRQLNA